MTKEVLREGERLDDLQRCGYYLIQNPEVFCFGIDAVLLSSFAKIKKGEKVMDLCTGNGAVPILLAGKTEASHVSGIEIQKYPADMAKRSVEYNELGDRVSIINGDIKNIKEMFPAGSFNAVTCNPPYLGAGNGIVNPASAKAIARHEICCDLEDVVKAAAFLLAGGGKFFMVHRPFRLTDIMVMFRKYHLEPKRMRLVESYRGKEPTMVLIEGVKSGGVRIEVEPTLTVYNEDGTYTEELLEMYY